MFRSIQTELFKLRKRSLTWILLYVLIGIMIIVYLSLYAVSKSQLAQQIPQGIGQIQNLLGLPVAIPYAFSILSSLGAVLAVILIASSAGNEYNWRTIRLALISSESRLQFLGAKIISMIIVVLIGMLIGLAVGFIMSLITTAIGRYAFDFSFSTGTYWWDQFLQFWRTFFIIMFFVFMGLLFAIVGRSAMPGIATGIGILFLEPIITALMTLAGGWVAKIPNYLFSANVNAINALNKLPGNFGRGGPFTDTSQLPSVNHAFIVLGIYLLFFIGLTLYLFHKRDVTG